MSSILQSNTIITGFINSNCLVCESSFGTVEKTITHINNEEHVAKLLACPYLERYGNNGIRKMKAGYFCEYCSLLMATAAKVNLHIAEKQHYYNKGNSLLKLSGTFVSAFDDVLISESAWNSFADDACTICNVEFDEKDEHKVERAHIIKLLENQVQFGDDNNLYRKINKNDFQCLTCNCVLLLCSLDDHFNDETHKQKYIQCQKDKKEFDLTKPKESKVAKIKPDIVKKNNKIHESANKETVAGNPVAKEATITAETTPNTKIMIKSENKTDNNKADAKNTINLKEKSTDPATYAKNNKIAYDPRKANAFCITCEKKFPSSLQGMKEHIQGRHHASKTITKKTAKPARNKIKLDKLPMEEFVTQLHVFDNILGKDMVVNETICVEIKSLHVLTKIASSFREYKCQICSVNVCEDGMDEHCKTATHEKGMRQICIITNFKNEFIREVRPETFHCGYCNILMSSWDATKHHLKGLEHKNCIESCGRRLQKYLPSIRAHKNEEKLKAAFFDFFCNHMRC